MTQAIDLERLVTDWLHRDATDAGADRVMSALMTRLATAPQERKGLRRLFPMQARGTIHTSRSGRLAFIALVAIVGGALAVNVLPTLTKRNLGATFQPSQTVDLPSPDWRFHWPVEMTPGSYGGIVGGVPFTFRVPENGWWSGMDVDWGLYVQDDPANGWVRFWNPDQVYADPCAHTLKGPIGPGVNELVTAMTAIPGTNVSSVTDASIGGFPAKHLQLTASAGTGCIPHDFYLWRSSSEGDPSAIRRPRLTDSLMNVWVVDIYGRRLVIDTDVAVGEDTRAFAMVEEIVSSIQIVPLSEDVLAYVTSVGGVCARAGASLGSDPAVIGGFRQDPPVFRTLDAAAAHADAAAKILDDAQRELGALLPAPDPLAPGMDAALRMIGGTADALREVSGDARAGNAAGVGSHLVDAYLLTHGPVADAASPMPLWLLEPSLAGCRLPSGGG